MAESISEGTLKQFSFKVGEYVKRDEELATIETDKIDVAINAPESGTIKELLVNEEDTVTVGQDVAIIETGAAPPESSTESSEPKKPAGEDAEQAPPEAQSKPEEKPAPPKEQNADKAEQPKKQAPPPKPAQPSQPATGSPSSSGAPGSREERRVSGRIHWD